MSLIEKLGGYAEAKKKFRDNGSFHGERLKRALLECRRQHGIFEVGDKVVYHTLPHQLLFYVKAVLDDSIVVRECWDEDGAKCFSEFSPYSDIRHATDKEITQGYRDE